VRPGQWTKNCWSSPDCCSPAVVSCVVGAARLAAFVIFCGLSGVVYLLNDILDRDSIAGSAQVQTPIASGRSASKRNRLAIAMGALALAGSVMLLDFRARGGRLSGMQASIRARSARRDHDVLTLSIGFVLRAVAGRRLGVDFTTGFWMCTILWRSSVNKRRHEITLLATTPQLTGRFSRIQQFARQMIAVVTASTLIRTGVLHLSPETQEKSSETVAGTDRLVSLYGTSGTCICAPARGRRQSVELLLTDARPRVGAVGDRRSDHLRLYTLHAALAPVSSRCQRSKPTLKALVFMPFQRSLHSVNVEQIWSNPRRIPRSAAGLSPKADVRIRCVKLEKFLDPKGWLDLLERSGRCSRRTKPPSSN